MDKSKGIRMVAIRLPKQKLKSLSCKNSSKNSNPNLKSLQFKTKNSSLIFKRIRNKQMPKELFVRQNKNNVTFKEMRLTN